MDPDDMKPSPDSGDQQPTPRERRRIAYGPPSDPDRRASSRSTADDGQAMSRNAAQQSWSGGDERKRTSR